MLIKILPVRLSILMEISWKNKLFKQDFLQLFENKSCQFKHIIFLSIITKVWNKLTRDNKQQYPCKIKVLRNTRVIQHNVLLLKYLPANCTEYFRSNTSSNDYVFFSSRTLTHEINNINQYENIDRTHRPMNIEFNRIK